MTDPSAFGKIAPIRQKSVKIFTSLSMPPRLPLLLLVAIFGIIVASIDLPAISADVDGNIVLSPSGGMSVFVGGIDVLGLILQLNTTVTNLSLDLADARTRIGVLETALAASNANILLLVSSDTAQNASIADMQQGEMQLNISNAVLSMAVAELQVNVSQLFVTSAALNGSINTTQLDISSLQSSISVVQNTTAALSNSTAQGLASLSLSVAGVVNATSGKLASSMQIFSVVGTTTYMPVSGLLFAVVEVVGGGGGGSDFSGGGGGGYARSILNATVLNATQQVTVGAGGSNSDGFEYSGSMSSFSSLVHAAGGAGGSNGQGGYGGAGITGKLLLAGSAGTGDTYAIGGGTVLGGGGSYMSSGQSFGGGGGLSGAGGGGVVIVTEYYIGAH